MADGIVLNPARGRTTRGRSTTRWRSPALPAVEVHLSDVDAPRGVPPPLRRSRDLCIGTVSGKGPDGYRDALARLSQELASHDACRTPARASPRALAERELDLLLVTDLINVRWLTGFTGSSARRAWSGADGRAASSPTSAT